MPFSQDPIGSAIGSANAITVQSGLIPWGQLIGQLSDIAGGRGGLGGSCRVVQAFIDPLSNTAQHLVVVADFPMGPVKITAGSPARPPHPSPPSTCFHKHGAEWKHQELVRLDKQLCLCFLTD